MPLLHVWRLRLPGDEVVAYGREDYVRALRPEGVDVVADFVGGNLERLAAVI